MKLGPCHLVIFPCNEYTEIRRGGWRKKPPDFRKEDSRDAAVPTALSPAMGPQMLAQPLKIEGAQRPTCLSSTEYRHHAGRFKMAKGNCPYTLTAEKLHKT